MHSYATNNNVEEERYAELYFLHNVYNIVLYINVLLR